jgi:hypothetical protein
MATRPDFSFVIVPKWEKNFINFLSSSYVSKSAWFQIPISRAKGI